MFLPHPNMRQYIGHFTRAPGIELAGDQQIQHLLARCSLLLTDYSSIAFDVALIRRPVVYFQFDRDEIWLRHTYSRGYFDYDRDGFGPVARTIEQAVSLCEEALSAGGVMKEPYASRARASFRSEPGGACEQIYRQLLQR